MAERGAPAFPWTEEIEDEILTGLADGKTPEAILGKGRPKHLPCVDTLYKRLSQDEGFAERYARALEIRTERDVGMIRDIALAPAVNAVSADGSTHVDSGDVQLRRTQIDALKWIAAKRMPKKYGDKLTSEHTGPNGGPLQSEIVTRVTFVRPEKKDA